MKADARGSEWKGVLKERSGVIFLCGYGIRVVVERGHLCVEDGIGAERRRVRFSRITRGLNRLVVIGHSGVISFDALRWLHDIGAAFVQIDSDGQVIAAHGPSGLNESRLRRAQARAIGTDLGLAIARDLLRQKLLGQAAVLKQLCDRWRLGNRWSEESLTEAANLGVGQCKSVDELRFLEGRAAREYWAEWSALRLQFEPRDLDRIPEHWPMFGTRSSPLSSPSPRRAGNPANALLNYLYAILEAEARIAALAMGLDPGLGVSHADLTSRDSLACDLMEPVRPAVDKFVLEMFRSRVFKKKDFFETREGICRLMPPLTRELAATGPLWARELAPITESVAFQLFHAGARGKTRPTFRKAVRSNGKPMPTPLTESNRSSGRAPYRRNSSWKTV